MDRHAFRHAIAARIGQVLTPALCAQIETEARMPPARYIDLAQFPALHYAGFVIHAERFADVLPELLPLHARHWEQTERHRHGLTLDPDYDYMARKDRAGEMVQFTVRRDGTLVGQLRMFIEQAAHSRNTIGMEDTLFIDAEHRGTFLAIHLLRYAEDCLRLIGVRELMATSKALNNADVLMRRRGFTLSGYEFHKIIPEKTS